MSSHSRLNLTLLLPYLILVAVSLAMVASVAPDRLVAQLIFALLGICLYLYLSRQDSATYILLTPLAYPLALLFLLLTPLLGESVRGSVRWITLGSFQFQPSELAKPLLVLGLSHIFARLKLTTWRGLLQALLAVAVPAFLIFAQPDLGTMLVVLAIAGFELFLSGISWRLVLGAVCLIAIAVFTAPSYLAPYQLLRIESFLEPSRDPLGSGYNVIQSEIAIGSGGVLGKGLGRGTQSHLKFLPERHTDFMFASLAEELGLLGAAATLALLTLIIYHLLEGVLHTRGQPRLILAGSAGCLAFQTCINIGMNLGVTPVTGVTLPFVSYGGSSLLALSILLGLASSLTHTRPLSPTLEIV